MTYITCAFINSENPTILDEIIQGWYVQQSPESREGYKPNLILYKFVEKTYPHPDAPKDSRIQVLSRERVIEVRFDNSLYSTLYLMLQAQTNLEERLKC